ncbi:MAG: primosomal protein N' [Rickettsiales bacterium]|nr:primosomal protein N' [Rickettsiales bacterium]
MKIAKILVPIGVYRTFDYDATDSEVFVGSLVRVPFRRRETFGLVTALGDIAISDSAVNGELKKIVEVLAISPLEPKFMRFLEWFADYNIAPAGLVLKLIFSEKFVRSKKIVKKYSYLTDENKKITPKQREAVNFLKNNFPEEYESAKLERLCSRTVLENLVKNEVISERRAMETKNDWDRETLKYSLDPDKITLNELSEAQRTICDGIEEAMGRDRKPILLEGITGSGKTEIYFHLFEKILAKNDGGQILFLLPEIALTNQFVDRFKGQFGCSEVAVWHSDIGDALRRELWNAIDGGTIRFVMGARSSLFLPFRNLRLVVVDEEHDNSYKQSDNISYNARNMAVVRAKFDECPIVLGSATPSLESLFNVENGKYNYFFLPNRFGSSEMPRIEIVDLTKDKLKPNSFLSSRLVDEMDAELSRGKQVLLFMNRRGYSPIALCSNCGHRFLCPNCNISLTVHMAADAFMCHHCGYRIKRQSDCPVCGLLGSIIFFGPGVEKIEREAKRIFPSKNTAIVTSDTVQNPKEARQILQKIMEGDVDIIIGTQMITKGYDFPHLTLVGVLDADASLFGANFRSAETTYQLLTQVTGRAGRRSGASRALVQSHSADNVIVRALETGDREMVLNFERESRKIASLPPYGRITALILNGPSESSVRAKMDEVINALPFGSGPPFEIFGPVPLNPPKLAGVFRLRLIVKTGNDLSIRGILFHMLGRVKISGSIRMKIEVDPYSL